MEYIIEAKSRRELREIAKAFRKCLGLENELYFPIVEVLDVLAEVFDGFSYEIVEDSELPSSTHADTDVLSGHIRIKQSVYERACNGEGRDRMTIAHEIGHYFTLCFCGFKFQRNFDHKKDIPNYCDPEWQAKCFAGELLVPADLVREMSPYAIAEECGVSLPAARYQFDKIK